MFHEFKDVPDSFSIERGFRVTRYDLYIYII